VAALAFSCAGCAPQPPDACNQLLRNKIRRTLFPASVVVGRGGLRTRIIGIAGTIIDKSMPPHFSEGLRFTSAVRSCRLKFVVCEPTKGQS
jgi:hypothetical protein